ncbi:unannotated protein [freshwater metagenome]|uniref:Unannotated protein n=1 Tax=freshwater metagenome TaxID=449393 RepID=A0A6J7J6I8_9ZZZZ|nr:phosphohistidine phosphatase SixA [Actinomycetota bacterium]
MARRLWLLRHGDAEPHGIHPDAERRLTDRGVDQARAAGVALYRLGVTPQGIYTSPKVRAHDTAAAAAVALGLAPVVHAPLASGFGADDALALVAAADDEGDVLIVGHEPDFSQIVHDLTGARIDMKKGGVACVRLDGSRGELIILLRPRELRAIR